MALSWSIVSDLRQLEELAGPCLSWLCAHGEPVAARMGGAMARERMVAAVPKAPDAGEESSR